ncbi:FUSC family protein [Rhizobium halophytocola]|uniref:Membrane protein YccC n=1 Tax=Rhizobium halophytocola TaxID=735519 RepID=A0ABS4DTK5_9HYPH|nr:FUSC family protein [Rhizobium halophytocola]MBP1849029.1 putative membrane protein YccC [Rhizobium halophytocola]
MHGSALPVTVLGRLGFDVPRLRFALRTALAASIALLVAWLLGLDHPQWAAMTVWAASQPTRGQLLEKGLFRALGTLIGVAAGIGLVVLADGAPMPLVAGLALWMAVCVASGNLLRGLSAYAAMLAGYSASMVSLLDFGHPDHLLVLGADRALTILTGVAVAVLIGWLTTPVSAEEPIVGRMRRATGAVLSALAQRLDRGGPDALTEPERRALAEMAAIDELLDPHAAGSLRRRRRTQAMRMILWAQIDLLDLARRQTRPQPGVTAADLKAVAEGLGGGASSPDTLDRLEVALSRIGPVSDLYRPLARLLAALRAYRGMPRGPAEDRLSVSTPILHRDVVGARQSALRAFLSLFAVGLVWVVTGYQPIAFLMLGLSIMVTIFSTFDTPAILMRYVMLGQFYGALGALTCRFLVWPIAGSEVQVLLLIVPFILFSAVLFGHRRTHLNAFDYAMVSLLLLKPHYPLTDGLADWLPNVVAIVLAPAVGLVAYTVIFPLTPRQRLQHLVGLVAGELEQMARAGPAPEQAPVWRARLHHRLLRMVRYAERANSAVLRADDGGLTALSLGEAIAALQSALRQGRLPPAASRAALASLERLKRLRREPERVRLALLRASRRIGPVDRGLEAQLAHAAAMMAHDEAFFAGQKRGGHRREKHRNQATSRA